ncbi:MAG: CsbD family protein [Anaerolineaceae bacterium]|nr:CsbD family protein [Anaerolineaceae bacterium]
MSAAQVIFLGKWHELKGQVRQQWGKLTDDDLAQLNGKAEELVGVLQQRYGYGKAQAEIEINQWLREHDIAKSKN